MKIIPTASIPNPLPADLAVRVRDFLHKECKCHCVAGFALLCMRCDLMAELTAQSVERASPAKDGGEGCDALGVYHELHIDGLSRVVYCRKCNQRFVPEQPIASQMPVEICGRCGKPRSELCGDDFIPMRPQSAVQGDNARDAARYRWLRSAASCGYDLDRVMFMETSDGKFWKRYAGMDDAIDAALAAAPQPPQGEG